MNRMHASWATCWLDNLSRCMKTKLHWSKWGRRRLCTRFTRRSLLSVFLKKRNGDRLAYTLEETVLVWDEKFKVDDSMSPRLLTFDTYCSGVVNAMTGKAAKSILLIFGGLPNIITLNLDKLRSILFVVHQSATTCASLRVCWTPSCKSYWWQCR